MPNSAPPMDEPPTKNIHRAIDQCPVCRYSLRGLPASYNCPECGFEYDEHTRVWRVTRSILAQRLITLIILALAVFIITKIPAMRLTTIEQFIVHAIIAVGVILRVYLIWGTDPFVAVTPKGIKYRWIRRTRSVPWGQIVRAGDNDATVFCKNRGKWTDDYSQFLPDDKSRMQFRRAVNGGKARYDSQIGKHLGT